MPKLGSDLAATPDTDVQPRGPGKPSSYCKETADHVVALIESGGRGNSPVSLRRACEAANVAPSTFIGWRNRDHDDLVRRWNAARSISAELIEGDLLEIADDSRNDWIEHQRKDGSTFVTLNSEAVQRSRLRIETRVKVLAHMDPKYAPRLDHRHKVEVTHLVDFDSILPDRPEVQAELLAVEQSPALQAESGESLIDAAFEQPALVETSSEESGEAADVRPWLDDGDE